MSDPIKKSNDNRGEWSRAALLVGGLLAVAAVVWAFGGRSAGEAWQVVYGAFSVIVSVATAVVLSLGGAFLIWHAVRRERGADRNRTMLWGVLALVPRPRNNLPIKCEGRRLVFSRGGRAAGGAGRTWRSAPVASVCRCRSSSLARPLSR